MKVQLEEGVWLAKRMSGSITTTVEENAKEFKTSHDALDGLAEARKFKPFPNATLEEDLF